MTELIAVLTTGKGSWTEVSQLIKSQPWERIFLITNDFGREKFKTNEKTELLITDYNSKTYYNDIFNMLKSKVKGLEIALNITSGDGREHMAVLAALIKLGVGFRLVTVLNGEFKEL